MFSQDISQLWQSSLWPSQLGLASLLTCLTCWLPDSLILLSLLVMSDCWLAQAVLSCTTAAVAWTGRLSAWLLRLLLLKQQVVPLHGSCCNGVSTVYRLPCCVDLCKITSAALQSTLYSQRFILIQENKMMPRKKKTNRKKVWEKLVLLFKSRLPSWWFFALPQVPFKLWNFFLPNL